MKAGVKEEMETRTCKEDAAADEKNRGIPSVKVDDDPMN